MSKKLEELFDLPTTQQDVDVSVPTIPENRDKLVALDDAIDKIVDTLPGYTKNGKQIYSAREINNVLNDNRFTTIVEYDRSGRPLKGGRTEVEGFKIRRPETDWEALKRAYANSPYLPIIIAREKRAKTGLASLEGDEIKLMQSIDQVTQNIRSKGTDILIEKNKFINSELGKIMPQYQDEVGTLDKEDKVTMGKIDNLIGNMYAIASKLGGKIDSESFDPATITSWRTSKQAGDLKYVVKRKADMSGGTLQIFNGNEVQEIPLNSKQLSQYFPQAAKGHPLDGAKYMIMGSATKTTNAMGSVDGSPAGAMNAAFTGDQLPLLQGSSYANLVRFDIEGAADNNGDDDDLYQVRMYVNDNGTWKSDIVNTQGFAKLDGIFNIIQNIGTRKYEEIKAKK